MTIRRQDVARQRLREARLYLVAGPPETSRDEWLRAIESAVRGGVDVVQLRFKRARSADVVRAARELKTALGDASPLVVVNDDARAARDAGADGVHLGQEDATVAEARSIVGAALVGVSTHTLDQALAAAGNGADYLGFGAMFPTTTKESIRLVGPEALAAVSARVTLPVFAIGGIDASNVDRVVAHGGSRIAVSRAILAAGDPERAARALRAMLPVR